MTAANTIRAYYDAFNAGDMDRFLALLTDDVAHDINQGARQTGKEAFATFMDHMNRCYREELTDMVVMVNEDGTRGAAEFIVNGTYLATDEGLPEANGQTYRLPAGAFFEIKIGMVARISNYYTLNDWVAQVCLLKNHATQTMQFCADAAVQTLGGMGYMRGTASERIYREVKVMMIGGGAEEIMKELAARQWAL